MSRAVEWAFLVQGPYHGEMWNIGSPLAAVYPRDTVQFTIHNERYQKDYLYKWKGEYQGEAMVMYYCESNPNQEVLGQDRGQPLSHSIEAERYDSAIKVEVG